MSGSATFTTVISSSSMKIATATAIRVHHLRSTKTSLRLRARRAGRRRRAAAWRATFSTRYPPRRCISRRGASSRPHGAALYEGSAPLQCGGRRRVCTLLLGVQLADLAPDPLARVAQLALQLGQL